MAYFNDFRKYIIELKTDSNSLYPIQHNYAATKKYNQKRMDGLLEILKSRGYSDQIRNAYAIGGSPIFFAEATLNAVDFMRTIPEVITVTESLPIPVELF